MIVVPGVFICGKVLFKLVKNPLNCLPLYRRLQHILVIRIFIVIFQVPPNERNFPWLVRAYHYLSVISFCF